MHVCAISQFLLRELELVPEVTDGLAHSKIRRSHQRIVQSWKTIGLQTIVFSISFNVKGGRRVAILPPCPLLGDLRLEWLGTCPPEVPSLARDPKLRYENGKNLLPDMSGQARSRQVGISDCVFNRPTLTPRP